MSALALFSYPIPLKFRNTYIFFLFRSAIALGPHFLSETRIVHFFDIAPPSVIISTSLFSMSSALIDFHHSSAALDLETENALLQRLQRSEIVVPYANRINTV